MLCHSFKHNSLEEQIVVEERPKLHAFLERKQWTEVQSILE